MYQNVFVTSKTETEGAQVFIWDDKKGLITKPYSEFFYAYQYGKDEVGLKSIYGDDVKKLSYRYWNKSSPLFESDVPRETRILIDRYLDSDDPSEGHHTGIIDIEVSSVGGYPVIMDGDKEVYSIAIYSDKTKQYLVFLLDKNNRYTDRTLDAETSVLRFDTEAELLTMFLAWFNEQKFTIITGWNSNGFDIPYLYNRIKNVLSFEDANLLSPVGIVKPGYPEEKGRYKIAGISQLDYLEMYKKFTYIQQPSYRLDAIGQFEIGMSKVPYGSTIDELYDNQLDKFIEYNIQDVRIVLELDKKLKLIELVRNVCHVSHVPYEAYEYSSRFIEGTILTYLHRKGIVCPNKPPYVEKLEKFEGAFVKQPIPGKKNYVICLDCQSLYPSIIRSLNVSPETMVGEVTNWNVNDHASGKMDVYKLVVNNDPRPDMTRDEFDEFMIHTKLTVAANGALYISHQQGVLPAILDDWFNKRKEYKALAKKFLDEGDKEQADYYDKRQHVQKIFLNSFYGALGLDSFRFYELTNAKAITLSGQTVIKSVATVVNNILHKSSEGPEIKDRCIYIDTDSIYVSAEDFFGDRFIGMSDDAKEGLSIALARKLEKDINEKYFDKIAQKFFYVGTGHKFFIKGEAVAKAGFWVTKKRYAYSKIYDLDTDRKVDKLVIKGLDVVRSSFPPAFGGLMQGILTDILNDVPKADIDTKITDFYNSLATKNYLEICRNTSIKNGIKKYDDPAETSLTAFKKGSPAHVKAAIVYNRVLRSKGLDKKYSVIRDGDKIKYTYLKQNPLGIETIAVKGYDDPQEVIDFVETYIDYKALFDRELLDKLSDFYEAMAWGKIPVDDRPEKKTRKKKDDIPPDEEDE